MNHFLEDPIGNGFEGRIEYVNAESYDDNKTDRVRMDFMTFEAFDRFKYKISIGSMNVCLVDVDICIGIKANTPCHDIIRRIDDLLHLRPPRLFAHAAILIQIYTKEPVRVLQKCMPGGPDICFPLLSFI